MASRTKDLLALVPVTFIPSIMKSFFVQWLSAENSSVAALPAFCRLIMFKKIATVCSVHSVDVFMKCRKDISHSSQLRMLPSRSELPYYP